MTAGTFCAFHSTFDISELFSLRRPSTNSPPRAPPGARYDPIGPGDTPPNLRGGPRFPGLGRNGGFGGGGSGGGNPFGGFGGNDFI